MGRRRRLCNETDRSYLDEVTGQPAPYALRDPKIDEKRVLFFCGIDRIATFGVP